MNAYRTALLITSLAFAHSSITAEAATIFESPVEPAEELWSKYHGFRWASETTSGLAPSQGASYIFASTKNHNQRGFYAEGFNDITYKPGIYRITFMLAVSNEFNFSRRLPVAAGFTANLHECESVPKNGDHYLANALDPSVDHAHLIPDLLEPGVWEQAIYEIRIPENSPLIGQKIGFMAKFYTGDKGEKTGFAFDQFKLEFIQE
ncbi:MULTISPECIES: hypothetical protein [unclassified Lentimonas]|uniref:hypothetical protein n=1 Tax=unclassified Lentimonas TaxID=2630993 RepID=UPI00132C3371|nr:MULTISPECIES: hypothetical protein [unclassified Lentimonas]CAA6693095.1 Unannotated [Lentimonas sp. CC19]CAA6695665.1 Unannotated [Lentimonas sp. CC10]CAA7071521.1 Unannotated [Lentimonas sp. CC11]